MKIVICNKGQIIIAISDGRLVIININDDFPIIISNGNGKIYHQIDNDRQ